MMKKLFNPIAHFDEKILITIGLVFVIINVILGEIFGFRMGSILKFLPSSLPILEQSLAVLKALILTIAAFYGLGWIINKRTRVVDIVNTFLIGIIPNLLIAPLSFIPYFKETVMGVIENPYAIDGVTLSKLMLLAVVSLPFAVLSIIIYYNGFKTATNMKQVYHSVLFALALFIIPTLIQFI
jgi:hypothetical protein